MADRALAHIETVHDIVPIDGADFIECAHILGWQCVVSKGEFKEGDKCVYIEIDSKVDTTMPVFEFMAKYDGKVKTRKLRGVYSQGLALSIDKFDVNLAKYDVGSDVTAVLGIKKIQTQEERRLANDERDVRIDRVNARHKKFMKSKMGKWIMSHKGTRELFLHFFGGKKLKRKAFPDFITKTDETRIENMPWELTNKGVLEESEKLDGTSTTFFIKRQPKKWYRKKQSYEFGVCSRNVRQLDREQVTYHEYNIYWAMADKYDVENQLNKIAAELDYPDIVCIQGESIGRVQGNPYQLDEDDFYVFNFIVDHKKWDSVEGEKYLKKFGIKWVPILRTDFVCPDTMEEMKQIADGYSVINPKVKREGCVYRSADNSRDFKNVSREYLMKHQD